MKEREKELGYPRRCHKGENKDTIEFLNKVFYS
jgi:hypothetical protein